MKTHDTLIQLLLDLEEEMRNRYNAHVEIEYFNESDIYLRMYFAPAGFGFNYRIDSTLNEYFMLIEKEYKHVNVKDLADHISVQVDRKIVEHFKKGNASEPVDPNELFAKGGMRMKSHDEAIINPAYTSMHSGYQKAYVDGVCHAINTLVEMKVIEAEKARRLVYDCLRPDFKPDLFDPNELFR